MSLAGTSIYVSLADRIRESIGSGKFAPGDLIGSEHELARQERISRMTVRKASELLIGEGLVERRPGKGLFVRHRAAVSTGGVVQVVVGNLLWDTCMQMARGVQSAATDDRSHVQIYDAHGNIDLDLSMIEQLPRSGAKGAVIVSLHHPRFSQAICQLHSEGFPFVLLDQRMRDFDVSAVTADNHSGGYQVGQLLAKKGHKRIAFLGDLMAATVQDRLAGFRDALGDEGIVFKRSQIIDLAVDADRLGDWSNHISVKTRELMSSSDRPTAIFCSCDAIVRQVYRDLATMGLSVPKDVSIVGFDDDPLTEYLKPKLTTVRQPFTAMGQAAMELLKERIANPGRPAEHRSLPAELVERDSVAGPPDA